MSKKDKLDDENISRIHSRKNKRLKGRRKRNAELREAGVKFSKKDYCWERKYDKKEVKLVAMLNALAATKSPLRRGFSRDIRIGQAFLCYTDSM